MWSPRCPTRMLKRIDVSHLSQGMFIHEFCGSWMEHPFWRTRFLLKSDHDLRRIRGSSIQEVWIDTDRGLDVAPHAPATTRSEADDAIDSALASIDAQPGALTAAPSVPSAPRRADRGPATMTEELHRASAICHTAKTAVVSMFREARMGQAIDARDAASLVEEISGSLTRNPGALISLARLKTANEYTYMHSVAVSALMVALARQLGLDAATVQQAGMAGLLHDLGKAGIADAILNKPGALTDEEFDTMRSHPALGHAMLRPCGLAPQVLDACLHHHEKIDGTGYPHRLMGSDVHLLARMSAICDVYDAITSNRPYKAGWDPSESLRRMAEWTKGHFDSRLFQAFVKCMGIYPTGSLVRLSSGHLAIVLEQSPGTLLAPRVRAFFSLSSGLRIAPETMDLSDPGCGEKILGREDPSQWNFPDLHRLWGEPGGATIAR